MIKENSDMGQYIDNKYLLMSISKNNYALELQNIKEIIVTPPVIKIPNQPIHQKGIISLRDKIIPLFDMRTILGYISNEDELKNFLDMLRQREKDHIEWLDELHMSIVEKREFRKTTDPHACAFGKWYDNFKTNNIRLGLFLRAFDEPHKSIHKSAIDIQRILKEEGYDAALNYYKKIKETELSKMIKLFHQLYEKIEETMKSYSIIINHDNTTKGFIVDEVEKISIINEDVYIIDDILDKEKYIKGIIKDGQKDYMVMDYSKLIV